ncbi:uroporphyrinogen-III synthase [Solibacillus sp. CAU 1738]|uniref:uroporphyrinogen-III synthase n=1 Tax=Solibacillus sp. CAU 1738 TaxID=3140363 RepID=UPI0032609731
MLNDLPLARKTIYVTGTQKVQTIEELVQANGGKVKSFPLIDVQECIAADDAEKLAHSKSYEWLIFTSQNAVESFVKKLHRAKQNVDTFLCKIAAVGTKTAKALENSGFTVEFMPSIFSADVFVKEFPLVAGKGRCLFLRGNLAKTTIRDALACDEWTVYETVESTKHIQALAESLIQEEEPIVIFASPSAVKVYAQYIVPDFDWSYITIASIGHITTAELKSYGATVDVQPDTYTMKAVVEHLIIGGL